jgi:hypothetical protein
VKRFWATGDRGVVTANGRLTRQGRRVSADWRLQARDFRIGLLAVGAGVEEQPPNQLDLALTSQGRTYRDHAASLNGRLHLTGGKGRATHTAYDKVLGDFFNELIATVNPFANKEKYTKIECTAAAMDIAAGVMRLQPGFVTRTDKIDISVNGSIDLKKEVVDVQFRNAPRKGIGLSAAGLVRPFFKVGGTLAKPNLELNPQKALVSGTAAVATGGLSLIAGSLLDRLSTTTNPCEKMITEAGIQQEVKSDK